MAIDIFKGVARNVLKFFLAVILVLVLFVGGGALLSHLARVNAENFCAQTAIGEPWRQVEQRVASSKANQRQSRLYTQPGQAPVAYVTFIGMAPLERHICKVTLKDNRVSEKSMTYLD